MLEISLFYRSNALILGQFPCFFGIFHIKLLDRPIFLNYSENLHRPSGYNPFLFPSKLSPIYRGHTDRSPPPILLKMRTHDVSQPHASPNVSHGARPLLPDYRSQTPNAAAAAMKLLCTSACGIRALLHFSTLIESFYRPYRTCSKARGTSLLPLKERMFFNETADLSIQILWSSGRYEAG